MNKELEKMKYGGYSDLLISKQNEIETLQQELQRKDNIINELKKYCEENIDDLLFECEAYYKDILDKIKELESKWKNN